MALASSRAIFYAFNFFQKTAKPLAFGGRHSDFAILCTSLSPLNQCKFNLEFFLRIRFGDFFERLDFCPKPFLKDGQPLVHLTGIMILRGVTTVRE